MSHWSSLSRSRHKLLPVLSLRWGRKPLAAFTLSSARSHLIFFSGTGLRTTPAPPFPELGAAGQSDTRSPVTSVAASSPLWHLQQYRPQRDFLYCIKLAERRFSRCVAVPLASCDPVSQQILPWLWRICFSLSKFVFIRAILRESVLSTHRAIFLILGGWTYCWYLNHDASLE